MASKLRQGDPMRPDVDLEPKVNQVELEKLERMVALGGGRPEGEELQKVFWYAPTVLTNVRNDMDTMQQEIFGPISPVMAFDDFDEAIELANDTKYGLTAYLFINDIKRMMRAVQSVRFGEVYITRSGRSSSRASMPGYGLSGIGGDDGQHGFDHYFRKKTVYVNYGDAQTAGFMPYGLQ
jgi:lactaldehyde dehydrogenase / glycolaldehyde dehydrogenase